MSIPGTVLIPHARVACMQRAPSGVSLPGTLLMTTQDLLASWSSSTCETFGV